MASVRVWAANRPPAPEAAGSCRQTEGHRLIISCKQTLIIPTPP